MAHSSRVLTSALRAASHVPSFHTCRSNLTREIFCKRHCHVAGAPVHACEKLGRIFSSETKAKSLDYLNSGSQLQHSTPVLSHYQKIELQKERFLSSQFLCVSDPSPSFSGSFLKKKNRKFAETSKIFLSENKNIFFSVRSMASLEEKTEKKNEIDFDFDSSVVTPEWLSKNLENVKVLDASWHMPGENRNALSEFQSGRIPGAIFFDIDGISDSNSDLPHMLPSESAFSASLSALSLKNTDPIVVYDKKGIFSAARAWWMFRAFGHEKIWVLQGGYPKYESLKLPITLGSAEKEMEMSKLALEAVKKFQKSEISQVPAGSYVAHLQPDLVWSVDQILQTLKSNSHQIVDARPAGRFKGVDPEPRKGVRGGHIPGSANVPFPKVLTPDGFLRDVTDLKETFESAGVDSEKPTVASCGTGVTACILALALYQLGKKNVAVYDGSWTEWGSRTDTPVNT